MRSIVDERADEDLTGADLRGAVLEGVDLRGIDLTGVRLDVGQAVRLAVQYGAEVDWA